MIDTTNKFMVAVKSDKVLLLNPPLGLMTAAEALTLAAWLVAMAEAHSDEKFAAYLEAVQNT